MNIYNRVNCGGDGRNKNTGFDCYLDPKLIIGGAYVPSTFKLTRAQLATPGATIAALKAAAKADDPSQRIYPFHNLVNPTDNSEDLVTRTATDGTVSVVREGVINWGWQFTIGGLALHKALRTHNANGGYFIFWDSDYTVFGWGKDREIHGIPVDYKWVTPWKQNDGSNPTIYELRVSFKPRYTNEEMGFAKLNNTLTDVKGLRDINIVINDFNGDDGTVNFSLLTEDSAYNLYDLYSDELSEAGLYALVNDQTGEEVSILSLTPAPADKSFDMEIDTADDDYPLSDGDTMTLSMSSVSDLEEAGVIGFEGLDTSLEITSGSGS